MKRILLSLVLLASASLFGWIGYPADFGSWDYEQQQAWIEEHQGDEGFYPWSGEVIEPEYAPAVYDRPDFNRGVFGGPVRGGAVRRGDRR